MKKKILNPTKYEEARTALEDWSRYEELATAWGNGIIGRIFSRKAWKALQKFEDLENYYWNPNVIMNVR